MTPEQMAATTVWSLDEWNEAAEILGDQFPAMAVRLGEMSARHGTTPSHLALATSLAMEVMSA